VVVEEAQRVANAITQDDGAGGVAGVGDPDLELAQVAFAADFVAQLVAALVGDVDGVEQQRVVETLVAILDGNQPDDAVPGAGEARAQGFGDQDVAFGQDGDFGVEAFENNRALLPAAASAAALSSRRRANRARRSIRPPSASAGLRLEAHFGGGALGFGELEEFTPLEVDIPATMLEGNWAILVLKSRTTAL
jgi:hypothetical protein